eukprot:GHVU01204966.1.p1 GENE.GHVU01204966.1~~GHVU01204966.1.p1  ORF type:complete len:258 (-),score=27.10 GHVU01204966.1:38-811(-)
MAKASLVLLLSTVIVAAAAVGETASHAVSDSDQVKLDKLFTKLLKKGRIVPICIVTKSTKVGEFSRFFQQLDDERCWGHLQVSAKPEIYDILKGGTVWAVPKFGPALEENQRKRAISAVSKCDKDSKGFDTIKKMFWEIFYPYGDGFGKLKEDFTIESSDKYSAVVPKVEDDSQARLWALKLLAAATDPTVGATLYGEKADNMDIWKFMEAHESPITLLDLKAWHRAAVKYVRKYIVNNNSDLSDPKDLKNEILEIG